VRAAIEFFFKEIGSRNLTVPFELGDVVWCHGVRNDQYHGGGPTVPRVRDLSDIRNAALMVFSILFEVSDAENLLKIRVAEMTDNNLPKRDEKVDRLIDERYGVVQVAGMPYYTSELLYAVDPFAYGDVAAKVQSGEDLADSSETE
jgi:hypothetical protein